MTGRIIIFFVFLIFIFAYNAKDFDNILKGHDAYIQKQSGLLSTCVFLLAIPSLFFDLEGNKCIITIVILEVLYVSVYTYFYLKIRKKQREEEDKEKRKPQRLGTSFRLVNVQNALKEGESSKLFLEYESDNSKPENVEVKPPWEGRTPLGEQPHYKMLNNLMHLTRRFNHLKREYYLGLSDEKELSEVTTQPLLYSLVVCKRRLDRLGLKIDEEIIDSTSDLEINRPQYNMQTVENDRDEYGIRSRMAFVKRKIFKGNKCIYKHKDKEMSVISILRFRVKGDIAYCPNCGYSGKIPDFMNGCAACGTSFALHDFEPKIADYSLKQNEYLQIENIIDLWGTKIILGLLVGLFTGFPIWCVFMVLNALLNYPEWLESIDTIFCYVMKIIIPLFIATTIYLLIVHVILNSFKERYGEGKQYI